MVKVHDRSFSLLSFSTFCTFSTQKGKNIPLYFPKIFTTYKKEHIVIRVHVCIIYFVIPLSPNIFITVIKRMVGLVKREFGCLLI